MFASAVPLYLITERTAFDWGKTQHNLVVNLHFDHNTCHAGEQKTHWDRKSEELTSFSVVSPLFVLSQCVSGSSVWRVCTTRMTRCKGPIALQEGSRSKARWTFTRVFSLCGFANGYSYFEFISTTRRYLHCAILRYFVKKFAKGVVKEDANTTTPKTKRANTVIFHQHKFQHISFICDYT